MADRVIAEAIWVNPDRVSGQPCFVGTRLPIALLFDWLSDSRSVDEFSQHWDVPLEVVLRVLRAAEEDLLEGLQVA